MTVGERLAQARRERKLTQPQLAKLAGVRQPTISDLERGRSHGSKHVATLAAALGVSALWLERGQGPKHASPPLRAVPDQHVLNTQLMLACMRAAGAYRQQYRSTLDDEDVVILACRLYEQHRLTPETTAATMLSHLAALTEALR